MTRVDTYFWLNTLDRYTPYPHHYFCLFLGLYRQKDPQMHFFVHFSDNRLSWPWSRQYEQLCKISKCSFLLAEPSEGATCKSALSDGSAIGLEHFANCLSPTVTPSEEPWVANLQSVDRISVVPSVWAFPTCRVLNIQVVRISIFSHNFCKHND